MPRIKEVFRDSSEVCHIWAQQSQESGRNPTNNIYFRGATLYSYGAHYPLAMLFNRPLGRVCLINSTTYSKTTTRQQGDASQAVRGTAIVLRVPHVIATTADAHRANIAAYFAPIPELLRKQRRARANDYRPDVLRNILNAQSYTRWMGCASLLTKRQREMINVANSLSVAVEGRTDDERLTEAMASIAGWNADELADEQRRQRRTADERRRHLAAESVADKKRSTLIAGMRDKAIAAWRKGAKLHDRLQANISQWVTIHDCLPMQALLRVSADGQTVETSLGANVPVEHAKLAWRSLCNRELPAMRIGAYTPDAVGAKTFRIGCHVIPMSEVDAIAEQLGLGVAAAVELSIAQ